MTSIKVAEFTIEQKRRNEQLKGLEEWFTIPGNEFKVIYNIHHGTFSMNNQSNTKFNYFYLRCPCSGFESYSRNKIKNCEKCVNTYRQPIPLTEFYERI